MTWRREDIHCGDRFLHEGEPGRVYEVVGIADKPTVTLASIHGKGTDRHFVIESPLFAEWSRLQRPEDVQ